jgi:NitT/TauT family transport system substrate-binding protein
MGVTRREAIAFALAGAAALQPWAVLAQDATTIRLASPPSDDVTPALYAIKAGIFKKYGLNVEITHMNSGAATIAAVAGGSIGAGLTSVFPLVSAHARGVPVQILAPAGIYDPAVPYSLMIVKKGAPIKTGRDLNGKTIASSALKDLNAIASMAWIDQHGGDSSTVRTVEVPQSALLPALDEGRIDAVTIVTPFLTQALESGKVAVLGKSFQAIANRFAIAAWVTAADFATKNPDVAQRFVRAMHESTAYTNVHHAETVDMMAEYASLDPKTVARSTRSVDAEFASPRDIQPLIDVSLKYKIIDRAFDPAELISPAALRPSR